MTDEYDELNMTVELNKHQKKTVSRILNKRVDTLLNASTGYGKSIVTQFIAKEFETTLILCPRESVYKDWKKSIKDKGIVDAKRIHVKMQFQFYNECIKRKVSPFYNLVVVDECHMQEDQVFGIMLNKDDPCCIRYDMLLGLSASPKVATFKNPDARKYYDKYFKWEVVAKNYKQFEVEYVHTPFRPKIFRKYDGQLDYNAMILELMRRDDRKKYLLDFCLSVTKPKTLIMCKFIDTIKYLADGMRDKFQVSAIYANEPHDESAEVWIGSMQKMGVGYDINVKFEVLIMLDNVLDVLQYLGRLRVNGFTVYDITDKHPVFENHRRSREMTYNERRNICA